jgi:hypothetical protein
MEPIFKAASSLKFAFFDDRSVFKRVSAGVPKRIVGAFSPSARILRSYSIRINIDSSYSRTSLSIMTGRMPASIILSTPNLNSAKFIKLV